MALKSLLTAATLATVLVGGALACAPAASASVSQGYISGSGTVTDDWGDEGPLSMNSHRYSRATAAWQLFLKNEGFYTGSVDCDFGPATRSATIAFQQRYGLTVDGIAGPQTLGRADNFFVLSGEYVYVSGLRLFRRSGGVYYVYDTPNDAWRSTSYTSAAYC
ncbi:peptidoglycan-binding domain-containing protein [Verrucosispora sp. WMMD573]|uniref:peptidoglycan-binding domain-containing protein n=1 Tax=Verrucosispora sp. WMMD573 TaxID=3015149 RepID=UPI0032B22FAF